MSSVVAHARASSSEDTPKPTVIPTPSSPNRKLAESATISSREATVVSARAASEAPSAAAEPEETAQAETDADVIDMETFEQILELDEDDLRDFSSEMVWQYFSQAQVTFTEMDEALAGKHLETLSSLGHFLKGSSAALGVTKVQETCEKIQHYGKLWDDEAGTALTEQEALDKIAPLLVSGQKEYTDAEKWLKAWYKERGVTGPAAEE